MDLNHGSTGYEPVGISGRPHPGAVFLTTLPRCGQAEHETLYELPPPRAQGPVGRGGERRRPGDPSNARGTFRSYEPGNLRAPAAGPDQPLRLRGHRESPQRGPRLSARLDRLALLAPICLAEPLGPDPGPRDRWPCGRPAQGGEREPSTVHPVDQPPRNPF